MRTFTLIFFLVFLCLIGVSEIGSFLKGSGGIVHLEERRARGELGGLEEGKPLVWIYCMTEEYSFK